MKLVHLIVGSALLMGAGMSQARTRLTPEQRLEKITAGRVAGKPVNCIYLRDIRSTEIIDKTAIAYTANNGTVYVNRPSGASFLDDDDILVTKTFGSQLCSIDIVQLVDRGTRFPSGSLGLSEFVPYPKPPKVKAAS